MRAALADSQQRIQAMALIHETLYRSSDLARIDFRQYLHTLAAYLSHAHAIDSKRIRLTITAEEACFDLDTAIPCGLLLSELLSNVLTHTFPTGEVWEVRITLRQDTAGSYVLEVRDTGVGFPEVIDFRRTHSLGLQLACLLTEQLGGTLALTRDAGTTFTLTFPG